MSDYRIIIKKGVAHVRRWVPEKREHEIVVKKEPILSDALQMPIDIEETTFGEFFEFIIREADLFEKIFKASMYRHPIQPYIDEIRKDPDEVLNDIWRIEVRWGAEFFEGELSIGTDFGGYGSWDPKYSGGTTEGGIAIEYTPLNNYKNIPFVLDKNVDITELEPGAKPLVKAVMDFTVYDVINAILYEITWSGDISKGRKGPFDDMPPDEIKEVEK